MKRYKIKMRGVNDYYRDCYNQVFGSIPGSYINDAGEAYYKGIRLSSTKIGACIANMFLSIINLFMGTEYKLELE